MHWLVSFLKSIISYLLYPLGHIWLQGTRDPSRVTEKARSLPLHDKKLSGRQMLAQVSWLHEALGGQKHRGGYISSITFMFKVKRRRQRGGLCLKRVCLFIQERNLLSSHQSLVPLLCPRPPPPSSFPP